MSALGKGEGWAGACKARMAASFPAPGTVLPREHRALPTWRTGLVGTHRSQTSPQASSAPLSTLSDHSLERAGGLLLGRSSRGKELKLPTESHTGV